MSEVYFLLLPGELKVNQFTIGDRTVTLIPCGSVPDMEVHQFFANINSLIRRRLGIKCYGDFRDAKPGWHLSHPDGTPVYKDANDWSQDDDLIPTLAYLELLRQQRGGILTQLRNSSEPERYASASSATDNRGTHIQLVSEVPGEIEAFLPRLIERIPLYTPDIDGLVLSMMCLSRRVNIGSAFNEILREKILPYFGVKVSRRARPDKPAEPEPE